MVRTDYQSVVLQIDCCAWNEGPGPTGLAEGCFKRYGLGHSVLTYQSFLFPAVCPSAPLELACATASFSGTCEAIKWKYDTQLSGTARRTYIHQNICIGFVYTWYNILDGNEMIAVIYISGTSDMMFQPPCKCIFFNGLQNIPRRPVFSALNLRSRLRSREHPMWRKLTAFLVTYMKADCHALTRRAR